MLGILNFKCEHANNDHRGDGEETKRFSKTAAHHGSQFWSGKYLVRHSLKCMNVLMQHRLAKSDEWNSRRIRA